MKEFKLSKVRAKTDIIFKDDKDDDWFVYIIHFERKTGKEISKTMIVRKDVNEFLESYYSKGWIKEIVENESKGKRKK